MQKSEGEIFFESHDIEVEGVKKKKTLKCQKVKVYETINKDVEERKKIKPFNVDENKIKSATCISDRNHFFTIFERNQNKKKQMIIEFDNEETKLDRDIKHEEDTIKKIQEDEESIDHYQIFLNRINKEAVIKVTPIPDNYDLEDIRKIFSKFGNILVLNIPRNVPKSKDRQHLSKEEYNKHPNKGIAFIYYDSSQSSEMAIKEENQQVHESLAWNVLKTVPREKPQKRS